MRLATLTLLASLALTAATSPVGTASADCEIYTPDGGCTNACSIITGVLHKVDPKVTILCTE